MIEPISSPVRYQKIANKLIDWYWAAGIKRRGPEAISSGTWLSNAYAVTKKLGKIASQPTSGRKTMALWGPSQAGKSTLLSGFLDRGDGQYASALQWQSERNVMFVGADQRSGLRLNPNNFGGDASGCVTRFSLAERVESEDFPVEFVFADSDQLLEAIAIGYITECEQESGVIAWDSDQITRLLNAIPVSGGIADRKNYDLLHDFTLAVDDLILARWPRYRNLAGHWTQIKASILESGALLTSTDNTCRFISRILWDGQERLTEFYLYLLKQLKQYTKGRKFYASYDLTRHVLDISSAEHINASEIENFCAQQVEEKTFLGASEGKSIANSRLQFATFQALIWEIRVPINAQVLRSSSLEVANTLAEVDILDFPGVAQQGAGGSKPKVADYEQLDLFTKILKRGKTASVVVSYARTLGIDGFSLLIRMQNPVPNPDQLIAGLTAWCQELGLEWPPSSNPPPLNIVLTFSAKLVNIVAQTEHNENTTEKLSTIFDWFENIQPIADHRWAKFWTTSYPQFGGAGEGAVTVGKDRALDAIKTIMENSKFSQRFAHDPKSLERMALSSLDTAGDGAVGHFLTSIPSMLAASNLQVRREAYIVDALEQLRSLSQVALPRDVTGNDYRKADISAWQKDIVEQLEALQRGHLEEDAATAVASAVLAITGIDPEVLSPLPQNAETRDLTTYLAEQVRVRWLEAARLKKAELLLAGMDSPTSSTRRLTYLADEVAENSGLADWIKGHLGQLEHPEECKHARRFLALKMSDILLYGPSKSNRTHRSHIAADGNGSEVNQLLNQYANYEVSPGAQRTPTLSPHYAAVLKPFIENLSFLAKQSAKARAAQPGDREMAILIAEEGL